MIGERIPSSTRERGECTNRFHIEPILQMGGPEYEMTPISEESLSRVFPSLTRFEVALFKNLRENGS